MPVQAVDGVLARLQVCLEAIGRREDQSSHLQVEEGHCQGDEVVRTVDHWQQVTNQRF